MVVVSQIKVRHSSSSLLWVLKLQVPFPTSAKFWTNPQFLVTLTDVDHDDEENLATVIIALMQKDSRLKRLKARTESAEEFIQFRLFKVRVPFKFLARSEACDMLVHKDKGQCKSGQQYVVGSTILRQPAGQDGG